MSEHSVTAILVAYNSEAVIGKALAPLLASPRIAAVIVIDNCSTDDTCDLIRRDFPDVRLIDNPKNEGFGRANNIGLNRTETPYALLVNPDAVMGGGAIDALLAVAERYPDAAILAPRLFDEIGQEHKSYKNNVFEREKRPHLLLKGGGVEGDLCAEFLSGAVWLLNMKLMRKVGFFDPKIFLYYEDDDLCLRARRAGHGLVLVHDAAAMHLMGQSSGAAKPEAERFKQKHMSWGRLYLEEKYHGRAAALKLALRQRLLYGLKASFYTFMLDFAKVRRYRARIEGIFEWQYPKNSA